MAVYKTAVKKLRENEFSYLNVSSRPPLLKYLCGLDIEQFNTIYEYVKPYLNLIEYPDCKGTDESSLDSPTELLAVLTCCRHALHQGVMAYILRRSEITVQKNFYCLDCALLDPVQLTGFTSSKWLFVEDDARIFHQDWTWAYGSGY